MNYKSLKYKIFIIFYIPAIALIYFSYTSLAHEYKQLNYSSAFKLSAQVTDTLSNLIHNIQIERGLSAGYVAIDEKHLYKNRLEEQYKKLHVKLTNHIGLMHYIKHDLAKGKWILLDDE